MPANYLHGVEFIKLDKNPKPIRLVKSAVIGIVGCAPTHLLDEALRTVNKPVLVLSDVSAAANFGPAVEGFSIPESLTLCQLLGAATIICVNVFDPTVHKRSVVAEALVLGADLTAKLAHVGYNDTMSVTDPSGVMTGFDYDPLTGVITALGPIASGAHITATYDYPDPTMVTDEEIIGGVNELGARTGMSAWQDARNLFSFAPKILIAPGYSSLDTVAVALRASAAKLRAVAYCDAPVGTSVTDAIAGRGPAGDINFYTSDGRTQLFFPHLAIGDKLVPYSAIAAGLRAYIDIQEGYWVSLSNHEIPGITGVEIPITADYQDATSEANHLNEVGITTVFAGYGTGYRTWGNRLASWPASSGIETFEVTCRVDDVIMESIAQASLQFIDRPINLALLDAITESVRGFLRMMQGDGAIIDGTCWYTVADNPDGELQQGHVTIEYDFLNSPPLERLRFKRAINLGYFGELFKGGL